MNQKTIKFYEWLAGQIDANGYFSYSKKGYVSLEITTDLKEKKLLYSIKQALGGSVKQTSKNHIRYRLHNKVGLIELLNNINGKIRNPIRLLQMERLCQKYSINQILPTGLNYENGWLSGFLDGDGSIYLNFESNQIFITARNRNKNLLDPLMEQYDGNISVCQTDGKMEFKWMINKKEEILEFRNKYQKQNPLKSTKQHRIYLIPLYYDQIEKKAHLNRDIQLTKQWTNFIKNWNKYNNKEMVQDN